MQNVIVWWLRKRFGVVRAIAPPIGLPPWGRPGLRKFFSYRCRWAVWVIHKWLFDRYGQSIRDEWDASYRGGTE